MSCRNERQILGDRRSLPGWCINPVIIIIILFFNNTISTKNVGIKIPHCIWIPRDVVGKICMRTKHLLCVNFYHAQIFKLFLTKPVAFIGMNTVTHVELRTTHPPLIKADKSNTFSWGFLLCHQTGGTGVFGTDFFIFVLSYDIVLLYEDHIYVMNYLFIKTTVGQWKTVLLFKTGVFYYPIKNITLKMSL